jgi:hypothetical protein
MGLNGQAVGKEGCQGELHCGESTRLVVLTGDDKKALADTGGRHHGGALDGHIYIADLERKAAPLPHPPGPAVRPRPPRAPISRARQDGTDIEDVSCLVLAWASDKWTGGAVDGVGAEEWLHGR